MSQQDWSGVIHPDQTVLQPVIWTCQNPQCKPPGRHSFDFQSDYAVCPKCKAEGYPLVQKVTLIHFLLPQIDGPIAGQYSRYCLPCDPKRDNMATQTNGEAATDQPQLVNCPGCLNAMQKAMAELGGKILGPSGRPLDLQTQTPIALE